MKIDKLFAGLSISSLGLTAQRRKMNAIASNMANVETTKTENGEPYRRHIVTQSTTGQQTFASVLKSSGNPLAVTDVHHIEFGGDMFSTEENVSGGVATHEAEDKSPFRMVYDPSHPDADETGYVKMPNVNVVAEMIDMLSASRAYEANVTAANAAKVMAKDALDI